LDQAQRSRRTSHSGSNAKELIGERNFSCRLMLPLDAMTAADHFDDKAFAQEDGARRNAPFLPTPNIFLMKLDCLQSRTRCGDDNG
jgi:hypothetical protein